MKLASPDLNRLLHRARIGFISLGCALSACAVGPDYRPPQVPTPDEWHALPETGVRASTVDDPTLASWWKALNDPILDQLIERALADNKTLKQAVARVAEARARRAASGVAPLLPSVDASAGASRTDSDSRRSGSGGFGGDDNNQGGGGFSSSGDTVYSGGLDARWEIDLFGGNRRTLEALTAQLQASEADLRDVLVTLLGDVALGYVNVRTQQARLAFAERNLEAQRASYENVSFRAEAGLASVLELERARTSYEQQRASLPVLESNLDQAMNRLAVLTGQPPGALAELLAERRPVPSAPLEIAAGVPLDALRRRPDIRSAERRLAAQTAQVGVATAALYPSLSLSGSISLQSLSGSDLISDGFRTDRSGLSLSIPLFRGGALRQNLNAQNAVLDQVLATYELTVLSAYEEVENALSAWTNEQRRHEALVAAVESARRASELAQLQYNAGLVDFETVLNADRQLISLEDALASSDGEMTSNMIRLYKALGGGWSVFPTTATSASR